MHRAVCLFTSQLLLVLVVPTHGGISRLSWPGWLVAYQDGLPVLQTVTHPSTNRAWRWLTLLMRPTTLPTKPNPPLPYILGKFWLGHLEWRTSSANCSDTLPHYWKLVALYNWGSNKVGMCILTHPNQLFGRPCFCLYGVLSPQIFRHARNDQG